MKTIKNKVIDKINSMPTGQIFTISDFNDIENNTSKSIYYAFKLLIEKGELQKLSRGKYFKPKKSTYGILKPKDTDILNHVIQEVYKKTKSKPFFASNTVFQKLGLTTQVSNEIFLVCNLANDRKIKLKNLNINLIAYEGKWNKKDIKYLEFLYAVDHLDSVPDVTANEAFKLLIKYMNNFSTKDIVELVRLSNNYTNYTTFLLSELLYKNGYLYASKSLYKNLHLNKRNLINYLKRKSLDIKLDHYLEELALYDKIK